MAHHETAHHERAHHELAHHEGAHPWMAAHELDEMLDLDAAVLHEYHREVITWAGSLVPDRARIVDLGAGTGTGSLALARHLPDAEVVAVDLSEEMLQQLRHKAHAAGVADRVRTVQADLDRPWPDLGPADLIWASASLHHLADPGHAAAQAWATVRPGGVVLAVELDSFPRFLPDGADAALELRCHAVAAQARAEAGMHMGEDWGAHLGRAGFVVETRRQFDIALRPPLPAGTGRYAQLCLQRLRPRPDDRPSDRPGERLDADDLAALDVLATEVVDRTDLIVRATRTIWLARRPEQ